MCVVAVRWWYRVLFGCVLNVVVMGLVGTVLLRRVLRWVPVVVLVCAAVVGVL